MSNERKASEAALKEVRSVADQLLSKRLKSLLPKQEAPEEAPQEEAPLQQESVAAEDLESLLSAYGE